MAEAATARCVAPANSGEIDNISATRKHTQAVAMTDMCQVATRMASLRLSIVRSSSKPAIIASIALINPAALANVAIAAIESAKPATLAT